MFKIPKIIRSADPNIKFMVAFVKDKLPGFLNSHFNEMSLQRVIKQHKPHLILPKRQILKQFDGCLVVPLKYEDSQSVKQRRENQSKASFLAGCEAGKQLKELKISKASFFLAGGLNTPQNLKSSIQGCVLQNQTFIQKKEESTVIEEIQLNKNQIENLDLEECLTVIESNLRARFWASQHLNPDDIEQICHEEVKKVENVKMVVIKGEELQNQGYKLLYNVGRASKSPPRLIHLHTEKETTTALLGKGITFDSGGLNLKTGQSSIECMHLDKTGAVVALSTFLSALKLGIHDVSATLVLAENCIDSKSQLPGSIIKTISGLNVEVENTDAEGRLCLADGIQFLKNYSNNKNYTIIDLATLTGACRVALGQKTAGLFSNSLTLVQKLLNSGNQAFEPLWHLPINEEHRNNIKSKTADIRNTGSKPYGGASGGAAFIESFVKESHEKHVQWAHLDIAGPAQCPDEEIPASRGFGTRLLLNYLKNNKAKQHLKLKQFIKQ